MTDIIYRELLLNESNRISEIDPSQYIERVWRICDGEYNLMTINYLEEGWPDGYDVYKSKLDKTIQTGGFVLGAFTEQDLLVGFVSLNREFFGNSANYVLLDSMFVSRPYRGKGIGNRLFSHCIQKALEWDADKLYLCAASSEDTIAFYKNVGCVFAEEINRSLFESDERDVQLEYDLHSYETKK